MGGIDGAGYRLSHEDTADDPQRQYAGARKLGRDMQQVEYLRSLDADRDRDGKGCKDRQAECCPDYGGLPEAISGRIALSCKFRRSGGHPQISKGRPRKHGLEQGPQTIRGRSQQPDSEGCCQQGHDQHCDPSYEPPGTPCGDTSYKRALRLLTVHQLAVLRCSGGAPAYGAASPSSEALP